MPAAGFEPPLYCNTADTGGEFPSLFPNVTLTENTVDGAPSVLNGWANVN